MKTDLRRRLGERDTSAEHLLANGLVEDGIANGLTAASVPLVEANQALVLSVLRAQLDVETAAQDIAFREMSAQLRQQAQRLGEENRQLVETYRLKMQFIASMSHELRTPLNSILGFSELLLTGNMPPDSPKHRDFLTHIHTSGQYLLSMVEGVLDLAKGASGKMVFHPELLDLQTVVDEVVAMLRVQAARRGVLVAVELQAGLGQLQLDRTRLKQVLANYLSNAIKFSHDGGAVTVRAQCEGERNFRVDVEDTGIGISPGDQARLFTEFTQVDTGIARRHEGAGLGLAVTRMLIEAQGGTVGLHSVPGVGSSFHFILRRIDPSAG